MKGMSNVQGQCYCSAVRFELTFPTEFCSHCHCEDCRRTHGAAFVTWTAVPIKQFKFLSGETKIKKYESHPGIRWGFCSDCGTSLLYDCDDAPEKIYVTVANLMGPLDRDPEGHVSFEESALWLLSKDHLPRYLGKSDQVIEVPSAGNLHHVDINVSNLKLSTEFWGWLLTELGYAKYDEWKSGMGWKLGETYIDIIQTEAKYLGAGYNRKNVGLNHLAFHAKSREHVEQLTGKLKSRGISVLYQDRHPFAGGPDYYAVFFEDPDRMKLEVAAP
jgi:catechol 2,3-dioxygenase-like lactoylglutathione lyase family enzyme